MQKESVLIELVAKINNVLKVQQEQLDEQVNNAMPQTVINLTAGKMIGLIEFRDHLQEQIDAGIPAFETSQGM